MKLQNDLLKLRRRQYKEFETILMGSAALLTVIELAKWVM